ncbi:MAG: putative type I polyketide synthase [Streblomastix strix]|uniref:Putative type I polyketide synthase n=1 Tax=Streblomastix strix TaxID=222440 RepID=A0A5J4WJT7_9EUKA|nr:MAG: putative type I polyketide synthase [Streblomastix strix]
MMFPEITIGFCKLGVLSPDGQCKAFDASANGYVKFDGAGMLLLKPLSNAERDGNRIRAIIMGTATCSDGKMEQQMTSPSEEQQEWLFDRVHRDSNIFSQEVNYFEAHDTGTLVGDPVECKSIKSVLNVGREKGRPIVVLYVKSNVGHLEPAAGIVSLIKVAHALKRNLIQSHNINGTDGLGGNGCGTQLQAATIENGHGNHQSIDNTGNEDNNEQANGNGIGQQQNNQEYNNESQQQQDNRNNKQKELGSPHTTYSEQELRNPYISQPKGQPPLIFKPFELDQVKGKVVVPRQRMQPTNDHDTRSKTGQLKSVPNKSLGSPEARANSDTSNHFTHQQEQRKKSNCSPSY